MRRLIGWLLALVASLLAVVALALLGLEVGWIADKTDGGEINWEIGALTFTGLATMFLALATFSLARQTQKNVDASTASAQAAQRSAEIAASSLAASIRPLLGAGENPPGITTRGENGNSVVLLSATLRNVGQGLAIVQGAALVTAAPPEASVEVITDGFALPAQASVQIEANVSFNENASAQKFEQDRTAQGFELEVRYSDMNGDQLLRTRAKAMYLPTVGWRYGELAVYWDGYATPFATLPRSVMITPPSLTHDRAT